MTNIQRRMSILSAAEKIFAEKGFHTATMDEIAQASKLAKGTLYLYFNSKDDLLFSILEQRIIEHNQTLVESLTGITTLTGAIEVLVHKHIDFLKQHHSFFRLNLVEQCRVEVREGQQFRVPMMEKHMEMMDRVISQIQRIAPDLTRAGARNLILTLTGACHAHLLDAMITNDYNALENGKQEIMGVLRPYLITMEGGKQ